MNAPTSLEALLNPDKKDDSDEPTSVKSATHYIKRGNNFSPVDAANLVLIETLPVGTYTVGCTPAGFYFEQIDDFTLNHKIYGDTIKNAERVLTTFADRPNATGVLLEGEKGSGKSMLMKEISIMGRALGMPTIVINSAFCGDSFNTFIQNLKQPAIIAFDEFEKVYDSDDQERLLTILDGTYPSKKLFVLTVNNKWRVDGHMRNRPGRIFYSISFGGLDKSFINEYCQDNLKNVEHIAGVQAVAGHFGKFTFDMLKALIEEMNRYGEQAADAMKWLNINPEDGASSVYSIEVFKDGQPLGEDWTLSNSTFNGNPLIVADWTLYVQRYERTPEGGLGRRIDNKDICLNEQNIQRFDIEKCAYHFTFDEPGFTAILTRNDPVARIFDYF